MAAVRENEPRAAVLGFGTYRAKLVAVVAASFLGGLGGIVHAIVLGGSTPHLTTAEFTLSLLVMVVLGGAGSRWGAVLGGFLYTYADARLVDLSGSSLLDSVPGALRQRAVAAAVHPGRLLRHRGLLRADRSHRARQTRPAQEESEMGQTPEVLEGRRCRRHARHPRPHVGPADDGAPVVLAAHGITANGLMWQPVADELARRRGPGAVRFLAPDLRGRALSNAVHGPFGLAAHASDLVCWPALSALGLCWWGTPWARSSRP